MVSDADIESLLDSMSQTLSGGGDFWPLKPAQFIPYIDIDQSLDLYVKIRELKERGVSFKEIAETFKHPSIIRQLLSNVACTGLKAARKLGNKDITKNSQAELVTWLLEILEELAPGDPVCAFGTNRIYDKVGINKLVSGLSWHLVTEANRRSIANLSVDLITFTWAFYWPYFPNTGYEAHGPYFIDKPFLPDSTLIIKDYFNISPVEVWPIARDASYRKITIYQIFTTRDVQFSFGNRILTNKNLAAANSHFHLNVDGKDVDDPKDINAIGQDITKFTDAQTRYVKALSDLQKVKMGAKLSYYSTKEFYTKYFGSWFPEATVDATLKNLGDRFIKSGSLQKDRTVEEKKRIFDPRNDYLP